MTIKVGDKIPAVQLMRPTADGPSPVDSGALFGKGTVVVFGVPGAFTPTCSVKHLPGFIDKSAALKAKGVDAIYCVAVNDAFVMGAWGKAQGADGKVELLSDGNGSFAHAAGLEVDLSSLGLGTRSKRFSMLVKNGVVKELNVEGPGDYNLSSADHMLAALG